MPCHDSSSAFRLVPADQEVMSKAAGVMPGQSIDLLQLQRLEYSYNNTPFLCGLWIFHNAAKLIAEYMTAAL